MGYPRIAVTKFRRPQGRSQPRREAAAHFHHILSAYICSLSAVARLSLVAVLDVTRRRINLRFVFFIRGLSRRRPCEGGSIRGLKLLLYLHIEIPAERGRGRGIKAVAFVGEWRVGVKDVVNTERESGVC
jgi:hypothetical protein